MTSNAFNKALLHFVLPLTVLLAGNLYAAEVSRDPLKDYVKILERYENKPYFFRAYVYPDETSIQVYIRHTHRGDHRYKSASVKWFDGTLKKPKLHDIDTDIDCSSFRYSSSCTRTEHMMIGVSKKSWLALESWARKNPESSLQVQIQANQSGEDFNFDIDASHIISFQDELLTLEKELN